ncbi:MAG: GTP-binding protein [Alphaproteobacteria bacterium]|nr:GTP-binding protein [Alphaproteobacteria bacterium]
MRGNEERIPVTVLTGYLGAGKTTLLNRILTEDHGRKYAVVINEFGELGVDNDLVVDADEEVFEMNNGCICCTVRGDLIRIIGGLLKRKELDGILIETTGLADPAPVAQTFFVDDEVRSRTRLDAIVTVVDARNLPARLADSAEPEEQIAFADVVLVNKIDLVTEAELAEVERRIRAINPQARLHRTHRATLPVGDVLGRGGFDLDRILEFEPGFLAGEDDHVHDSDVSSVSFELDRPLSQERFRTWIHQLLAQRGQDILRTKGILDFEGEQRRFAFQAVHMLAEGDFIGPWRTGAKRRSKLVFIGRRIDRTALAEGFEACIAAGA